MSILKKTNSLALNAVGITTALAFLAEEAEAATLFFTPDPSPYSNAVASFNPTVDGINSGQYTNLVSIIGCGLTQPEFRLINNDGFEGLTQSSGTALDAGVTLTASDFANTSYPAFPNDTDSFYLGFAFRASGSSDDYNLGWVELSYGSYTVNITQWAYETIPGKSIVTGGAAVPEPATTAMIVGSLALGGCLVARYFKLKQQRA